MPIKYREAATWMHLAVQEQEVHVWQASLQQTPAIARQLFTLLSSDEKARADRFRFKRHREAYILARGILRILLSELLHLSPEQVQFQDGPTGKPRLAGCQDKQMYFNLSHSHGLALYAISEGGPVGIDLEFIRPVEDLEQVAQRYFSAYEIAQLESLSPAMRLEGFYNCWTRKEAFVKAIGNGLAFPLDCFDVSLLPDEPARLVRLLGSEREAARWSMHNLKPAPGYVAALVLEGSRPSLSHHQWRPIFAPE